MYVSTYMKKKKRQTFTLTLKLYKKINWKWNIDLNVIILET